MNCEEMLLSSFVRLVREASSKETMEEGPFVFVFGSFNFLRTSSMGPGDSFADPSSALFLSLSLVDSPSAGDFLPDPFSVDFLLGSSSVEDFFSSVFRLSDS